MRQLYLLLLLLAASLCLLPACGGEDAGDKKDARGESQPAPDAGAGTPATSSAKHGLDPALEKRVQDAMAKGRAFLLTQQTDDGGFTDREMEKMRQNVAFTAMASTALVATTDSTMVSKDAALRKALDFIVKHAQENGSIFDDPRITNYCTSASVSALAAAKIGDYRKAQAAASAYLAGSQISDDAKNRSFGGFPYKAEQSADASNAMMAANALDDDGLPADSDVRERIGQFVRQLQNHSENKKGEVVIEVDDEKRVVVLSDDGGGFYRPDESKAGMVKRSDGKWELKSYGSMTYALLKLLLFAGTPADDPRVKAVVRWIANNWSVERNPGFENAEDPEKAGQQGIFYYLYTATRALSAFEQATGAPKGVKSADGREHNWRAEIAAELLKRQGQDGSWHNPVDRWEEGSKTLATSFAVQTLGYLTGRLE